MTERLGGLLATFPPALDAYVRAAEKESALDAELAEMHPVAREAVEGRNQVTTQCLALRSELLERIAADEASCAAALQLAEEQAAMRERHAECVRQWDEAWGQLDREGKHVRREALEKMRRLMDALLERLTQVRSHPSAAPPPPPQPRTARLDAHRAPRPAAQVELRLTDHVLLGTREEAERMHAAEGPDGDELRTTKYEIEQLEVRQRKQKKVLVKVAKMAVNAEGEHGAKLAEHHAALALSAELHASLVASAETLLAECAAARKKIREHHLLSVPTREVSRVEYLVPEGGDTEHWYLRETPAEALVGGAPRAHRPHRRPRRDRRARGADADGRRPHPRQGAHDVLGRDAGHDAQQPPIEVPLKTEEEKQRELETRATHTVYMGAFGATSVRVHPRSVEGRAPPERGRAPRAHRGGRPLALPGGAAGRHRRPRASRASTSAT